jgi:hypothetical protein
MPLIIPAYDYRPVILVYHLTTIPHSAILPHHHLTISSCRMISPSHQRPIHHTTSNQTTIPLSQHPSSQLTTIPPFHRTTIQPNHHPTIPSSYHFTKPPFHHVTISPSHYPDILTCRISSVNIKGCRPRPVLGVLESPAPPPPSTPQPTASQQVLKSL